MRFFIGGIMLVLGLGVAVEAASRGDLISAPRFPAYQSQVVSGIAKARIGDRHTGDSLVLMDVDGDGQKDIIYSQQGYIAAVSHATSADVLYYQINIPPEFTAESLHQASAALLCVPDLDHDGRENLIAWGHTRDRQRWWFWNLDPTTGAKISTFELPGGADTRADGRWDGNYYVAGAADVQVAGESVRALIIGCTVGYDKYGRGALAVDPRNGNILWRFEMGPNPFRTNTRMADLDGDGLVEIILLGRSPGNLHGELVNGTTDTETRLFVLSSQGQLLWSQVLGPSFGNGELDLADMNGDGTTEIVTVARTTPDVWGEIVVWTHNGRPLTRHTEAAQLQGAHLVQRQDREHPSLLVASSDHRLLEFDFTGNDLILRRSVRLKARANINLVADILPAQGSEIVVATQGGPLYILDHQLRPLLVAAGAGDGWAGNARLWRPTPDKTMLIWPGIPSPTIVLSKAPFAWQRLLPYGIAAAVCLVLGLNWRLVRRPRRVNPRLLRETRLTLLDSLELSSHGAVAPLKCVRRLVWQLRALQTDPNNKLVEVRMREAWSECRDSALPHVKGIVDRARVAGLAADNISVVATSIAEIEKQVEIMAQNNFQEAAQPEIAERLEEAEHRADSALIRLRAEVATHFRANVAQVFSRIQQANHQALVEAQIQFHIGQAAMAAQVGGEDIDTFTAPADATGLCDTRELEFVLDNLVGNAITAMQHAPERHLHVSWRTTDGMILIDVTDTGGGLIEANWDRALNTRYSTKPTGGAGLPNSRKCLRKYGGNLTILNSTPRGSTFRVTLPVN